MSRFIAVSFLFMGWAFYELSGGADFQPHDRANSGLTASTAAPAPAARVTAGSLITRPVMRPADLAADRPDPEPALQPLRITDTGRDRPLADPEHRTEAALQQIAALGASLAPGGGLFPQAPQAGRLQVAALEGGLASLAVNAEAPQDMPAAADRAWPDLREVTANSVNMRGGPGTGYPVIGRMTRGQQVEVLSDAGTGWLRLRDVENNRAGWIAASLISRKAP